MRKKINAQFAIITMVAILFTVILSAWIYYDMFQREVTESLKLYTRVLKTSHLMDGEPVDLDFSEYLRVTLINEDGTVCYDTDTDAGDMDNHRQRPEVWEAFARGEGCSVRHSVTLKKDTFYYAVLLKDGRVLRVAKEAGSMGSFLIMLLPALGCMGLILLAVCMALGHFLTKSLLDPILQMTMHMDDERIEVPYKEMEPFIDTIQQQHRDIVKSSMMRQEFTANVSHELKTPLTAISGYSELIESGMASEWDTIRFAGEIHKSSNRLLTLINDILRLSELDAADAQMPMEPVKLYELSEKCVNMLQINADKHDVTLGFAGDKTDEDETEIYGNREMIEELLYNLCSNAIRYNVPDGNVTVSVESAPEDHQVILTVEDTGIGIPDRDQERVFERFYRVDKSRSKSTGGTGLGLAIVKHIVAKHGADIRMESQVGKGTRIQVIFPAAQEEEDGKKNV